MWNYLTDASNALGASLICLIMVLMCFDVASRNLANKPLPGVADIVSSTIVAAVFLGLPNAIRSGRLTRAELFFSPFANACPKAARVLETLFMLIGVAACLAIAFWTWPRLQKAWSTSEFVGIVGILTFPSWPVRAIVFAGSMLAALQYVVNAARTIMGLDPLGGTPGDMPKIESEI
ncbi:TRAP transporter small permease subunit [Phaeovulum sp. W22_SRMD_FR3]